ncbi:hypothetical protein ColTof4_00447 [Colletotrichum tofieldiae]|nr:hypothetical protein ColTof3_07652 [Colletotrichum tofieldiae]GKT68024.1 hypothetical protein ColTof4_00447 [Colletotrichum tofieldiae]GKT90993.1 hypothetical protein Ct61P_08843 [Colletotrichum tofieldiae]
MFSLFSVRVASVTLPVRHRAREKAKGLGIAPSRSGADVSGATVMQDVLQRRPSAEAGIVV